MRLALLVGCLAVGLASFGCSRAPDATAEAAPPATAEVAPPSAKAQPQRAGATALKPLDKKKFGADITEKSSTALDDLLKTPSQYNAKTVRTEGVVSAVCKSMGCWMEIADDNGQAHIKMAGHSFFVPKDASGHRAIIQGKVVNADPDHCTEEAREQTGKIAKIEIEATGVEFVD